MGRVRYIPNQQALDNYYSRQSGSGYDPFFQGAAHQRGHGLGGLFGKLFRAAIPVFKNTVVPVLKRGAKAVAREALTTGVGVASDMLDGGSGVESLQRRLPDAGKRLGNKGVRQLSRMLTNPSKASKRKRKSIKRRDIYRN